MTSGTGRPMNTNRPTTTGTRPFGFFSLDEFPQPAGLDVLQILNHAHAVLRTVASVQTVEERTGKTRASGAGISRVTAHDAAIPDFAIAAGLGFVGIIGPAAGTLIPFALIGHAKRAIHPAGGDKVVDAQRLRWFLRLAHLVTSGE